jgi:hypothetical protein
VASPLSWELIQEAEKRAEREVMDTIEALTAINVGSNGETFGTEHMSREDRMLAFIDDWNSGAVQCLHTIKPEFAEQYVRQYQRDVAAGPVMRAPNMVDVMGVM